jgi:hypothetical protein
MGIAKSKSWYPKKRQKTITPAFSREKT